MARYIDADLLLEELENNTPLNWTDSEIELQEQFDFQVFKHIIEYQPTADVVPKSEEGAECPTCHGTGRIGTTDWLTKGLSKKQIAEEKARAIAEHEQYIKIEIAREIFEEIENPLNQWIELYYTITVSTFDSIEQAKARSSESVLRAFRDYIAELKKKYTEDGE